MGLSVSFDWLEVDDSWSLFACGGRFVLTWEVRLLSFAFVVVGVDCVECFPRFLGCEETVADRDCFPGASFRSLFGGDCVLDSGCFRFLAGLSSDLWWLSPMLEPLLFFRPAGIWAVTAFDFLFESTELSFGSGFLLAIIGVASRLGMATLPLGFTESMMLPDLMSSTMSIG